MARIFISEVIALCDPALIRDVIESLLRQLDNCYEDTQSQATIEATSDLHNFLRVEPQNVPAAVNEIIWIFIYAGISPRDYLVKAFATCGMTFNLYVQMNDEDMGDLIHYSQQFVARYTTESMARWYSVKIHEALQRVTDYLDRIAAVFYAVRRCSLQSGDLLNYLEGYSVIINLPWSFPGPAPTLVECPQFSLN